MLLSVTDWWNTLNTLQQVFWAISLIFSFLFLIQFGLSLFGGDTDHDLHHEVSDGTFSVDPSFTLLSVRSIIAFFTFFGWMGVLALGRGYTITMVLVIAVLAGFIAMAVVAILVYYLSKLAEEGNPDLDELIYRNATVYLTIPERRKGMGKIHVVLKDSLREMDAVTEGERLENGKSVKIVEVLEDHTLVVEPVEIFDTHVS